MNTKQLNILHADDDVDDCYFFKNALDQLQISASYKSVQNGEELMLLLTNETIELPDILFLDINMPRKDGFECLVDIKNNIRLKNLPIIMLSTSNSKDNISLTFKNGAHLYIHKPSDFSQLKQVILHALPIAAENVNSKNPLKYIINA